MGGISYGLTPGDALAACGLTPASAMLSWETGAAAARHGMTTAHPLIAAPPGVSRSFDCHDPRLLPKAFLILSTAA